MYALLARVMYRRRRWVAGIAVGFVLAAGGLGAQVFGRLGSGGPEDPGSDSRRAAQLGAERLGRGDADVVVLYRASNRATVDDPSYRQAVTSMVDALPSEVVARAVTYWTNGSAGLVSADRRTTLVALTLHGDDPKQRMEGLKRIEGTLRTPTLETEIGGRAAVDREIADRVAADIVRAEMFSLPVLLVLLVVIFGGLVAAALPLAVGVTAFVAALAALYGLTVVTDISVYAVQMVTLIGFGLAIDYGLFMVTRFREEIRRGLAVEDAVARTMATAGRTVAFSAVTLAACLAGLLIFPAGFHRSMGLGGMAAVLSTMLVTLVLLPALLGMLGPRVDALRLLKRHTTGPPAALPASPTAARQTSDQNGAWYRLARIVMRRPATVALGVTALLIFLGLPLLRIELGGVDHRLLPPDSESRRVSETLSHGLAPGLTGPAEAIVTLSRPAGSPAGKTALDGYLRSLKTVPGVSAADVTAAAGNTVRITIGHRADPIGAQSRDLVRRLRRLPPPPGGQVLIGGRPAETADMLTALTDRLPWMALITAGSTFALLFFAFGSVVLPIKALLMNVLSLGASFGAMVWIFQDGHLDGLLGFTPATSLDAGSPVLVLAVVFGLSMDYEVFLMSRIREHYDLTGDNTGAVAAGLQRTGRIITSAALLLIVVIAAFSTSDVTSIKMTGVVMIIALVIDVTVVRALLVPATMRLLGHANWWAPRPLTRLYQWRGQPSPAPSRVRPPG
ncbi:MMPL family transporter [Spirillospora sp. NPDC048911]|uniref:MMPL family transporter n=1 Tax=Spirillospora sp. NPDC048911 TaxID=3364527 RepID=UPI003715FE04